LDFDGLPFYDADGLFAAFHVNALQIPLNPNGDGNACFWDDPALRAVIEFVEGGD
jgi:hypothetical protein